MNRTASLIAGVALLISACGATDDATDKSIAAAGTSSGIDATATDPPTTENPVDDAASTGNADGSGSEDRATLTTAGPDEDTVPPLPTLAPVGGFCEPAGDVTRPIQFAAGTTEAALGNVTTPGQSDLWYIEVGDEQIMAVTLTSPGSDTVATLLPPDLTFVPGAFVRTTVAPTDAGIYWICVIAGDTSDRYALTVSVIDDNTPTKVIADWCGTSVNDRGEIRFATGSTSGQVDDAVIRDERDLYTLEAAAGQTVSGTISAAEGNAILLVRSPSGADLFESAEGQATEGARTPTVEDFMLELPESGDYELCVGTTRGNATYTIDLTTE